MGRIAIYFLEFDDDNTEHLGQHGIAPEEVEQLTGNPYVTARNARGPENRIFMIGQTDGGRMLTIVLEATHDEVIWRPITGWSSTAREQKLLIGN
ncbi:MAG: hypothetical protein ACXVHQ_36650 [Solirubrobacteraceae bacterium]